MYLNLLKKIEPSKSMFMSKLAGLLFPGFFLLATTGCVTDGIPLIGLPGAPPPPKESFVLGADGGVLDKPIDPASPEGKLAGAKELFRNKEYSKAEKIFHRLADDKKNPLTAEEGTYYEAECLRLQGYYPKAADTYVKLLKNFERTAFREQAVQHMYDIANYWLDDTREQMRETKEYRDGKRWFVTPRFLSFDKTKPLIDREGRAIEKLEQVRWNDISGPLADKALFLAGSVKFFNEDYREADHYFTQLVERHSNSELAPQAVELAIISKHMSTGGSDYDGRKVAEARQMVHSALQNFPVLAEKKKDFLSRQLVGITFQQAEKDFKMAEFYKRTGHPGSAYFYYELVRRRYPNTKFAEESDKRMAELKTKAEKEHGYLPGGPDQPREQAPLVPEVAPAPKPLDRSVEEGPAPVQTQQGLPPHPDAKPVKDAKSVPMPKPLD
ncbi:outer membrane protein assembly factor BamD [bacterium]|jgi:tetratricopeptide (TPR) repeat protein|nr:outer membrane protein assembly factor BamD [bacterium]